MRRDPFSSVSYEWAFTWVTLQRRPFGDLVR